MIRDVIAASARRHGLPPDVVYGVCMQESGLDPFAVRYEPHYRWLVRDSRLRPPACSAATEHALQRMSWGLMQVMGAVIREQGRAGWLTETIGDDPEEVGLQVEYGCRHLAKAVRRWGGIEPGLAAYNAGSPRRIAGGRYANQYYVDRVLNFARQWEG
jgi:soluble lytic murein transglycosylase-like protein